VHTIIIACYTSRLCQTCSFHGVLKVDWFCGGQELPALTKPHGGAEMFIPTAECVMFPLLTAVFSKRCRLKLTLNFVDK
jgi:hypothetical protein